MEAKIPRPKLVPQKRYRLSGILLDIPALSGQVLAQLVQEPVVVDRLVPLDLVSLRFLLHVPEVLVLVQVESLFSAQTLESFVPAHFSQRSHFEGTLGDGLAVVLDLSNSPGQSVQLGHVLGRKYKSVVNSLALGASRNEHSVEFACEEALHLIELFCVLLQGFGQLRENKVGA